MTLTTTQATSAQKLRSARRALLQHGPTVAGPVSVVRTPTAVHAFDGLCRTRRLSGENTSTQVDLQVLVDQADDLCLECLGQDLFEFVRPSDGALTWVRRHFDALTELETALADLETGMEEPLEDVVTRLRAVRLASDRISMNRAHLLELTDQVRSALPAAVAARLEGLFDQVRTRGSSDAELALVRSTCATRVFPVPALAHNGPPALAARLTELTGAMRDALASDPSWVVADRTHASRDEIDLSGAMVEFFLHRGPRSVVLVAPISVFEVVRAGQLGQRPPVRSERPSPGTVEALLALHDPRDAYSAYHDVEDALIAAEAL